MASSASRSTSGTASRVARGGGGTERLWSRCGVRSRRICEREGGGRMGLAERGRPHLDRPNPIKQVELIGPVVGAEVLAAIGLPCVQASFRRFDAWVGFCMGLGHKYGSFETRI